MGENIRALGSEHDPRTNQLLLRRRDERRHQAHLWQPDCRVEADDGRRSPTYSTTYYAYDGYGNKTAESAARSGLPTGSGIPSDISQTVTTYDSTYHAYPTQSSVQSPNSNPPTQTTTLGFDYVLGVVTSRTEPSGRVTHVDYDTFGRPTKVWDDLDSEAHPSLEFQYHWDAALDYKYTTTWQETTAGNSTRLGKDVCYDGFGRKLQTRVYSDYPNVDTVQAVKYNDRGLVEWSADYAQTHPYYGGCADFPPTNPKTVTTYDPAGNVATVTNPDGTSRVEDHSSLTAAVIDENTHKKTSSQNGLGETIGVNEYTGVNPYTLYGTTAYNYDRLGNLTTVTDAASNQTTMGYDMLGRKTVDDRHGHGCLELPVRCRRQPHPADRRQGLHVDSGTTLSNRLTAKSNAKMINSVTIRWRWRAYISSAGMYVSVTTNGQTKDVKTESFLYVFDLLHSWLVLPSPRIPSLATPGQKRR